MDNIRAVISPQGDIIYRAISETETTITMGQPLLLMVTPQGMGFMPISMTATVMLGNTPDLKADFQITMQKAALLSLPFEPKNKELVEAYKSKTSTIQVATSSIIKTALNG